MRGSTAEIGATVGTVKFTSIIVTAVWATGNGIDINQ
jgi:hypothetical protein